MCRSSLVEKPENLGKDCACNEEPDQKILTLELQTTDLDLSNLVGTITPYESPKFMQEILEQMCVNAQAVITRQFAGIRNSRREVRQNAQREPRSCCGY